MSDSGLLLYRPELLVGVGFGAVGIRKPSDNCRFHHLVLICLLVFQNVLMYVYPNHGNSMFETWVSDNRGIDIQYPGGRTLIFEDRNPIFKA